MDGGVEAPNPFPITGPASKHMEKRTAPSPGLRWNVFDEPAVNAFWRGFHQLLHKHGITHQERKEKSDALKAKDQKKGEHQGQATDQGFMHPWRRHPKPAARAQKGAGGPLPAVVGEDPRSGA